MLPYGQHVNVCCPRKSKNVAVMAAAILQSLNAGKLELMSKHQKYKFVTRDVTGDIRGLVEWCVGGSIKTLDADVTLRWACIPLQPGVVNSVDYRYHCLPTGMEP